jgi:ABC-type sugar transport system permease subunit
MGYFVVKGLNRLDFNRTHEQLANLYAGAVSNCCISLDINAAQRLIEKITKENILDIKIVEGMVFAAHSKKELIGQRVPKNLFDRARELGRTKKTVISWSAPETINVAVPLVREGKYIGIVDLNYKTPVFSPQNFGFILFGIFILFSGIYFAAIKFIKRYSRITAFALIALMIIISYFIASQSLNLNYENFRDAKDNILLKIGSALRAEPRAEATAAFINSQRIELSNFAEINKAADSRFIINSFIFFFLLAAAVFAFIEFRIVNSIWNAFVKNRIAYSYIAPATIGMLLLVFFPIFFGFALGFTDYSLLKFKDPIWTLFLGFKNFIDILSDFNIFSYQNFYYTLFITIIWTATNVTLHVGIGLFLAIILNSPMVAGRKIYRTLLILPWAVPNYITALIWRGMFQREFGAVNGLLNVFGISSIAWFDKPFTAFITNLTTNVWLGIPFMMVIALGALQSIPAELFEAADIDGASPWQKFRKITIPLLRPAMTPAIILGVVWTFNMFNIIYLVSGGAPYGATDILITSAYRWAFERYQYGYAAAYSTIIFVILLGYALLNLRVTRATESAYEQK